MNAYASDVLAGFGRHNSTGTGYELGQTFGDLFSVYAGLQEASAGGGLDLFGLLLSADKRTAVLAAPVEGLGAILTTHGVVTAAVGSVHFMEGMKGSSGATKKPKSGVSGREGAKDVPSWAKGNRPYKSESGRDFAKRLCDEKYGPGNYKTGPNSEYSEIKKWGDRSFE